MLLEFRVENFRSFKEEQVLSMVASTKDRSHPGNVIPFDKYNALRTAAIYGANASGKSNLIKALGVMASFVRMSATRMNQGDPIPGIAPFKLDGQTLDKPSAFKSTFVAKGTRFEYGFSATKERVLEECLTAYPKPYRRPQRWLERRSGETASDTTFACRGPLQGKKKILEEHTRENGLVLSRGAELNITELAQPYNWFRKKIRILDLAEDPTHLVITAAGNALSSNQFSERMSELLNQADFGIRGFQVEDRPFEDVCRSFSPSAEGFPPSLLEALKGMAGPNARSLIVLAEHASHGTEVPQQFRMDIDESNGTRRFFGLAGALLSAMENGAIVAADELECSMHPLLSQKLIALFQSQVSNENDAQLIFATHDPTLMNEKLLRRDQIWLVEKRQTGESDLYSLHDIKETPRTTTALQRNYLAGRFGGIPQFGPVFEDLETE